MGSGKGAEVGASSRPHRRKPCSCFSEACSWSRAQAGGGACLCRQTHVDSLAATKGKSRHSDCKQLLAPLRAGQAALPSVPTGPRVIAM